MLPSGQGLSAILKAMSSGPPRIVSLAPSCTSILHHIGAKRSLVAVTRWCREVAPVGGLPALGDCWRNESIEQIRKLRPTLIVGSVPFHPETVAKILSIPAQFLALNPRTLADIYDDIRSLGRLTSRASSAEKLIARMKKEFLGFQRASRPRHGRPRVYAEAWPRPRISSPAWVAELIELCGGKAGFEPGARVEDSAVAQAAPDIIVLAWAATGSRANPRKALSNRSWQSVPAIRNKRVFVISDELLNTPGPPLLDGAKQLAHLISAHAGGRG